MPYILKLSGNWYGEGEHVWPATNEEGDLMLFSTRKEAQAEEATWRSDYDGIAYWNVLSHNQASGSPAVPSWVSADRSKWPQWLLRFR